MRTLLTAAVLVAFSAPALGAVRLNEIFSNPPGTDNGFEFFELISDAPSESLFDLTFVVIEGDVGTSGVTGVIDQAISLTEFTTGTNNLMLWRDSALPLTPGPAPETVVANADFSPDLENGANTYLLVSGFTGAVGNDLDTNNDGLLDSTPWATVLDALGVRELATDLTYAAQLGFTDVVDLPFTPDVAFRDGTSGAWLLADVLGTTPGPFDVDAAEFTKPDGTALDASLLTPLTSHVTAGLPNPSLPSSPGLNGDYNGDGMVDAADYAVWRDGGSPDSTEAGYTLWVDNFGAPAAVLGAATPEPSSALLAGLLGGLLAIRRK